MRLSKRHRLEKRDRELRLRRKRKRVDPHLAEKLIAGQRTGYALFAGAVVAMAGSMVWMIVALSTTGGFQLLAIPIGAACGYAVGYYGKAVDRRFARLSAYCCILSCAGGEVLVAHTLHLQIGLLYTTNSLLLIVVFVLAGALTAHLCTFAWLSRDQKKALWDARHERVEPPSQT
jgi:hypothetical protein